MPRRSGKNALPFPETRFGKLPAELRDEIYHLALTMPSDARPEAFPWVYLRHKYPGGHVKDGLLWYKPDAHTYRTRPAKWLGLIQSCRQVHQEAVHIFYNVNQIAFEFQSDLVRFSKTFPNRFSLLTSVYIDVPNEHPLELMEALAGCPSLRNLCFQFNNYCNRQDARWLSWFKSRTMQTAIQAVRGLSRVEFSENIWLPPKDRKCRHTECPRYGCPHDHFFWGNQDRIHLAERIRHLMLRPKLISNDNSQSERISGTLTEDSPEKACDRERYPGTLKRKRELMDCSGEDEETQQEVEGGEDSEDEDVDIEESDEEDIEGEEEDAGGNGEPIRKRIRLDH
ncbi:MAG: hypothetical protein LQ343_000389 [Gyalolechia ehrenbergii]|nr:MAG: hypothetical protein LQ343_000389 [Gyalolechia ehrenbergii]